MFDSTIEHTRNYARTTRNYYAFKLPVNSEQLLNNQVIRQQSFNFLYSGAVKDDARYAVVEFWTNQAFFLMQFLIDHYSLLPVPQEFKTEAASDRITKPVFLKALKAIEEALEVELGAKQIIRIITEDCQLATQNIAAQQTLNGLQPLDPPTIDFNESDITKEALQEAQDGRTVVIMTSVNPHRPATSPYEKGSFHETLTRKSDLFVKTLTDFRKVAEDLAAKKENVFEIDAKSPEIVVWKYQVRFLKLIIHFAKELLLNPAATINVKEFLHYADAIYADIQNKVFEASAVSIKNCRFRTGKDVSLTSVQTLFHENTFIKSQQTPTRIFVVQAPAPDRRKPDVLNVNGFYDRGCTFNQTLRQSDDEEVAHKMLTNAIQSTLEAAVNLEADIIFLNAFGCGTYANDPTKVATIFAEQLYKFRDKLRGKQIKFQDLDTQRCWVFAQIISEALHGSYTLNRYHGVTAPVQILPYPIKYDTKPSPDAAYIEDFFRCKTHFTNFEFSTLKVLKMQTADEICQVYSHQLRHLLSRGITVIHTSLLGELSCKDVTERFQILCTAIQNISDESTSPPKIYVHVNNQTDFLDLTKKCSYFKTPEKTLRNYYSINKFDLWQLTPPVFKTNSTSDEALAFSEYATRFFVGKGLYKGTGKFLKEKIPNLALVISLAGDPDMAGCCGDFALVTALEWKSLSVQHLQIINDARSSNSYSPHDLAKAIRVVRATIKNKGAVYLHTKQIGNEKLISCIMQYGTRDQSLSKSNKDALPDDQFLRRVIEAFYNLTEEPLPFCGNMLANINRYLQTIDAKSAIAQLPSFKEIRIKGLKDVSQRISIETIMHRLRQANSLTILDQLCHADHLPCKEERANLYSEITEYLNIHFKLNSRNILDLSQAESSRQISL